MIEKDLFYYMVESNEKTYKEILDLIDELKNITAEGITDEQVLFVKDIYARLLFRIAVLEYKGYTDIEITKMLNINEEIELFTIEKVQNLKGKYRTILDIFYEMLEKLYKNVTVNEDINVKLKKKSKLNKITDIVKQSI